MPRKQDPAIAVIDYFSSAPIDVAASTLAIASSIVKKRAPKPTTPKSTKKRPTATGPGPGPATVGD